jgi:hypothetical protein
MIYILTEDNYNQMQIIESLHPYRTIKHIIDPDTNEYGYESNDDDDIIDYGHLIFKHTSYVEDAVGYIINFDPLTVILSYDTILIKDYKNKITFDSNEQALYPGIDLPSLQVHGNHFTVYFYTNSPFYKNLYGFKIYAIPGFINSDKNIFEDNKVNRNGGAIYFDSYILSCYITSTKFLNNYAYSKGGAISISYANVGIIIIECDFYNNYVNDDGGAIYLNSKNYNIIILYCNFINNNASDSGGVIYINSDNGLSLSSTSSESYSIKFVFNNFTLSNALNGNGGVMYISSFNNISITECLFNSNRAYNGGIIYSHDNNIITIDNSTMIYNEAYISGGCININDHTNLTFINNNNISHNAALIVGGAISLVSCRLWVVIMSEINETEAGMHDGLFFDSISKYSSKLFIHDNKAQRGSAFYFRSLIRKSHESDDKNGDDDDDILHHIQLNYNHASVGGTIYWIYDYTMKYPPKLHNNSILFSNNTALYGSRIATQTIYTTCPSSYEVIVYGKALIPTINYKLLDYYHQHVIIDEPTNAIVKLINHDDNVRNCNGLNPYISGKDTSYAGTYASNGTIALKDLLTYCSSKGKIQILITTQLLDLIEYNEIMNLNIKNIINLTFRECYRGEIIRNGQCQPCSTGKYSLEYPVNNYTLCNDGSKVIGITSCYSDVINVDNGYWRRFPQNKAILSCSLNINGCKGGNTTGNGLCMLGYEGPLCSTCSDGYYVDNTICTSCNNKKNNIKGLSKNKLIGIIIYACIISFVIIIICIHFYCKYKYKFDIYNYIEQISSNFIIKLKIVIVTYQVVCTIPESLSIKFPENMSSFLNSLNFVNLNILSLLPINCKFQYNFIHKLILTTISPIVVILVLIICYLIQRLLLMYRSHRILVNNNNHNINNVDSFNYNDNEHGIHNNNNRLIKNDDDEDEELNKIKNQYLNYFLYLTYIILPTVTTTIFQMYVCINIDPSHEDNADYDWYLSADTNIECFSPYWYKGVLYGSLMIIIYPIGIPLMYLLLLYGCKDELISRSVDRSSSSANGSMSNNDNNNRSSNNNDNNNSSNNNDNNNNNDHDINSRYSIRDANINYNNDNNDSSKDDDDYNDNDKIDSKQLSIAALRTSFLWEPYEPKYWYWEIIECYRRISLTALLSIISPGSSSQTVVSVLLSLIFIKMYGYYQPYEADNDDIIAEVGQFQIYITYFGALILQNSLLHSSLNNTVGK